MPHDPQENRIATLEDQLATTAGMLGADLLSLDQRLRQLELALATPAPAAARQVAIGTGEIAFATEPAEQGKLTSERHRGVPHMATPGHCGGRRATVGAAMVATRPPLDRTVRQP
jgi:hypothetical protein